MICSLPRFLWYCILSSTIWFIWTIFSWTKQGY